MRAIAAAEAPASRETTAPVSEPIRQQPSPAPSAPFTPTPFALPAVSYAAQPSVVQRSLAEEPPATEAEGQIDLAELSEQVYTEIRRRLAIEWERGRGRL
jgi:hypothetical protein